MAWTSADIPDQTGRRAVVTGATGGLGLATAVGLARHGAAVTITARDSVKGQEYLDRLSAAVPSADVELQLLDLADLDSAKQAATEVAERHPRIDILVNNAGVMATPDRTTADGFELQIGTNHLGHFAWTATLWPTLAASDARIVTISSMMHRTVKGIDLRSLAPAGSPRRYRRWRSYGESKLANLIFAQELNRRVQASSSRVVSVAAHPGYASTNLQSAGFNLGRSALPGQAMHQISRVIGQPAEHGAWPTLMAATDTSLTGGEYVGPRGPGQMRGRPRLVGMTHAARDEQLAEALWEASESATGVTFDV